MRPLTDLSKDRRNELCLGIKMKSNKTDYPGDDGYLDREAELEAAWNATNNPFVVVDIEVTGMHPQTGEVLEFSAVLVAPSGLILSEFSMLVRVTRPIPDRVLELSGITQKEIDRVGRPLAEAMKAFLAFVGSRPLFIHDAPFDYAFLQSAAAHLELPFENEIHDLLEISRSTWSTLNSHSLTALANHLGFTEIRGRCLDDAREALVILLAARDKSRSAILP